MDKVIKLRYSVSFEYWDTKENCVVSWSEGDIYFNDPIGSDIDEYITSEWERMPDMERNNSLGYRIYPCDSYMNAFVKKARAFPGWIFGKEIVVEVDHSAKEEKILLKGANGEVISGEIEPGATIGRGGRAPSEEENTTRQTGQAVFDGKLSAYSFILDKKFWDNPLIRLSDSQNCTAAIRNGVLHIQQVEKRPETINWTVIVYADKSDQSAKEEN